MADQLGSLAKKHGTDKVSHGYTEVYSEYFEQCREDSLKLLEIGVYRGSSIRMWEEYFPNAMIYGIDDGTICTPQTMAGLNSARVTTLDCDQSDRKALKPIIEGMGELDIVIDDGLHFQEHQQVSLGVIFPFVKAGGIYFIEDMAPLNYTVGTWGIEKPEDITAYVLEEFIKTKKCVSPFMTVYEKEYLEETIESIDIKYIKDSSIIAAIRKAA